MLNQKSKITIFFIFTLLYIPINLVRIDVNPTTNSFKIQLDQPSPFLLSNSIKKDKSPVLTIGILTLDITSTTEKILTKKYNDKKYSDFVFSEISPVNSGKEEILDFLQNINQYSMMATSYSKFLTFYKNVYVVPMNINAGKEYLLNLMKGLDGVLLTGGASDFFIKEKIKIDNESKKKEITQEKREPSMYLSTVMAIINKAKQINDAGRIFPVWGTCLGFEAMILTDAPQDFEFDLFNDIKKNHSIVLTDDSGTPLTDVKINPSILTNSNLDMSFKLGGQSLNMTLTQQKDLYFYSAYDIPQYSSFQNFLRSEYKGQQKEQNFYFYHHYGFTTEKFNSSKSLTDNYRILSISDEHNFISPSHPFSETNDKLVYSHPLVKNIQEMTTENKGNSTFVSAIENKKYPFYGVQFHPEKPLFDYKTNQWVNHSSQAINANKKFSSFFIQKLRNSKLINMKKNKTITKLDKYMTSMNRFDVENVGLYTELMIFKQAVSLDL